MEKRQSPGWDGKDPGKTLRPWLRSQLMWQLRTPTPPEQWGISLLEALQPGTVPKVLAETVPDSVIMSIDGYLTTMGLILEAN